jgi:hypothetical protein
MDRMDEHAGLGRSRRAREPHNLRIIRSPGGSAVGQRYSGVHPDALSIHRAVRRWFATMDQFGPKQ